MKEGYLNVKCATFNTFPFFPVFVVCLFCFNVHVCRSEDSLGQLAGVSSPLLAQLRSAGLAAVTGTFTCGANPLALDLLFRSQVNQPYRDCALLLWNGVTGQNAGLSGLGKPVELQLTYGN